MVRSAGPNQLERLVDYLGNFGRDNAYAKPVLIVFQSFTNDPEEAKLQARLQAEMCQRGTVVYSTLTGASRALSRLHEYHRVQQELAAGQ